ncbi:uncharacterized protein PV06_09080 [Exophiala oligosperma]|uniref:ZZ-type domain-containing protein n=1 Tax=Exophiala oligosperma TaxID=215243 RepID=A0A0D2DA00_9EURO|nr:uncharacterized protein PV06_09080 [Exophiala oligosperma]KIW39295.1 hypothetical protein PV06_09080 [Exophiala oligosperma]
MPSIRALSRRFTSGDVSDKQRPVTPPPPYTFDEEEEICCTKDEKGSDPSNRLEKNPASLNIKFDPVPDLSLTNPTASSSDDSTPATSKSGLSKKQMAKNYFLDFCYFPDDYDQRLVNYPDTQLKKQEAVKTRICYSSMCSIISGTAFAVPSHGASAGICVWAARRWYVAAKKLKFIKAELVNRGIELRPFLHRDWIIPASVAITCLAVGMGVDFGLAGAVPLGHADHTLNGGGQIQPDSGTATQGLQHAGNVPVTHATDPALQQHGGTASHVHSILDPQPGAAGEWHESLHEKIQTAAQNWGSGFRDQVQSLFGPTHHAISSGCTPDQTYEGAAAWIAGAQSAQLVEKEIMALLSMQAVQQVCERLDYESILPKYNHNITCNSLPWATDIICSRCETNVSRGRFYHCCDCPGSDSQADDEFNLCLKCHEESSACRDPKHTLQLRQTALPGRYVLPSGSTKLIKDIAGPAKLSCTFCSTRITRGWHYDCLECRKTKNQYTLCIRCYESGRTCPGDDTHNLYAFPRAKFASYNQDAPYQKQQKGQAPTGQATCSDCHARIDKGAFYHCSKCKGGTFDLCDECFELGEHCLDNDHVLVKFYAWKYFRHVDKTLKPSWKCSNERCIKPDGKDDFFFGCRKEECQDGRHEICPPCYFSDVLCPVKEHEMFKCVFV